MLLEEFSSFERLPEDTTVCHSYQIRFGSRKKQHVLIQLIHQKIVLFFGSLYQPHFETLLSQEMRHKMALELLEYQRYSMFDNGIKYKFKFELKYS